MKLFQSLGFSIFLFIIRTECDGAKTCPNAEPLQVITTTVGDIAVLPCSVSTCIGSDITVKWRKHSSSPNGSSVWPANPSNNSERVALEWGVQGVKAGNLSLSLRGVNRYDDGLYSCHVWQGGCDWVKNITLVVKDCKVLDQVQGAPYQTVTLPCSNWKPEIPIISASWSVVKGDSKEIILHYPPGNEEISREYFQRTRFNGHPESGSSSLILFNVQLNDSQWYMCNVTTQQNQRCFKVKLQVKQHDKETDVLTFTTTEPENVAETDIVTEFRTSPEGHSTNRGSNVMAATITLSTSVIVVIVVLLGVAICLRHRKESASRFLSAGDESMWRMYEDVNDLVLTPNTLYSLAEYNQKEKLCTFKGQ